MRELIAILMLAASVTPSAATSMKYPNWYAYAYAQVQNMETNNPGSVGPYLQCNYTTQTCLSGIMFRYTGLFAGAEVDGADRTKVLRHIVCHENFRSCVDFDEGVIRHQEYWPDEPLKGPDMSMSCVDAMRERRERCRGYSFNGF